MERTELDDERIVIIDCPPSLGVLGINCLTAASELIVAVHPGRYELDGLRRLQATVDRLRERINPNLHTMGVVLTNCDVRKKVTAMVYDRVSRVYPVLGLIRRDAQLQYACGDGTILALPTPHSHALQEYAKVADHIKRKVWKKSTVAT